MKRIFFYCSAMAFIAMTGICVAGDSDLDPTFGTGGLAQAIVGAASNSPQKIARQNDGKIIQVGSSYNVSTSYGNDFTLVRFNTNGTLDTSFDSDGKVTTAINTIPWTTYTDDMANAVAVQSNDGKIVAAGRTRTDDYPTDFNGSSAWMWWNVALIRYNTDGSLDSTFGTGGKVVHDIAGSADSINDIAFQSDGKIIAVGTTMSGLYNRFLIMRFNTNGTLDTTFGTSGIVIEHFTVNTQEDAYSVAVLNDNSLIVAGRGMKPDGTTTVSLLKLTSSGALDSTFDTDGRLAVTIGYTSGAGSVVVDSNGKFVVGASSKATSESNLVNLLLRYNANGTLDTTLDTDGMVTTSFGSYTSEQIRGVTIQGDGKIVTASELALNSSSSLLGLARYNTNGSMDTTFDNGDGKVTTSLGAYSFYAKNVSLQSDGKILVGGSKYGGTSDTYFSVFRYGADVVNLTMAVNPVGGGTTSPSVGTTGVLPSVAQDISATPSNNYIFVNWTTSGSEAVIANPDTTSTTVTLTGNATVTANFCLNQTWYPDADNDSYGDPLGSTMVQCAQPDGYVADNTDCNDGINTIHPGATEIPDDGIDQNCSGSDTITCFVDSDLDGYGTSTGTTVLADDGTCDTAQGESTTNNDCNDSNASIHPGATEIADDGIDQNCSGSDTITCTVDNDQDGYGTSAGTTVLADDGTCDTAQGESTTADDCNDANNLIHPGAVEVCDSVDNNCDGNIDEGVTLTWYLDNDGDSYGDTATPTEACTQPTGYVSDNTDCNDSDALEHPNQIWYKDEDGDGYSDGTKNTTSCERPVNYYVASELKSTSGDPDDTDPNIIPSSPWALFLPAIIGQQNK